MSLTININGLTLCHRGSSGVAHSTLPDVCKTPPPNLPVPYQNEAYSRHLRKGTTSCFADGGNMIAKLGSEFAISFFDEPGTTGGVKSNTFKAEADWITHSFNVLFEGKPACRLTDKMYMNHRNTVCLGGEVQEFLDEAAFEAWLCEKACECLVNNKAMPGGYGTYRTYQECLNAAINKEFYDPKSGYNYPKDGAQVWREVSFKQGPGGKWHMVGSKSDPGIPSHWYPQGWTRRPDITLNDTQGNIRKIYEIKFPGDDTSNGRMDPERINDYEEIARDTANGNYEEFNIEERCNCEAKKKAPAASTAADFYLLVLILALLANIANMADGPVGEIAIIWEIINHLTRQAA